jgi:CBS domain containing-hemolysin-like protein
MLALWIAIIAGCVLVGGYYAGAETGFYRLNRLRLSFRAKQGSAAARRLRRLIRRPDEFLITTLIGNNLFVYLATFICTRLYEPRYRERAEFMATLTLIWPIFIFGEVLQKEIFRRSADILMYRASRMLVWSARVFRPAVLVLKQLQRFWMVFARSGTGPREIWIGRQGLDHFFSESAQEGTLSPYQRAMAANIMKLQGVDVEKVMIPLDAAVSIRLGQTLQECRELARQSRHRRFPVRDDQGRPIGVVNVLDLLTHREGTFSLRRYLRKTPVFDRQTNLINALHLVKRGAQPMGFVKDSQGSVVGIVTIKDLVEEIVGELGVW